MTKRYAIWDKKTSIITPVGEVLTPEQWIERRPIAGLDTITVVCSVGEINGGYFGTLGQMKQMAEAKGADFSKCTTDEEILEAIEAFEDAQGQPSEEELVEIQAQLEEERATNQAIQSIAAQMEYQNMMTLEDA